MRPLRTPVPIVEAPGLAATLAASRGSYCAICETPLISERFVWDAMSGTTVSPSSGDAPAIDDALLICRSCDESQAGVSVEHGELALPHEMLTFVLEAGSPFSYELIPVDVTLDDDGVTSREELELVVVRPGTQEARRTIGVFGLNGGGWNEVRNTLYVPRHDWLGLIDQRAILRTEVWLEAERLLPLLLDGEFTVYDLVRYRRVIAAAGFPSVWATVLGAVADAEILRLLLHDVDEESLAEYLPAATVSTTSSTSFPGTNWEWLFPEEGPPARAGLRIEPGGSAGAERELELELGSFA